MSGGVREIALTKGFVALVDEADYDWLSQWKWCFSGRRSGGGYAMRRAGPRAAGRTIYMHRLIMGEPEVAQVDHINGDRLDNRRSNLRVCSRAENRRNTSKTARNSSGFVGVLRRRNAWIAVIARKHVGTFACPIEAARAYDAAARLRYGEFARLNFPEAA